MIWLEELITRQQVDIEEKKILISEAVESAKTIYMLAYGVWWPLNDNILWFNKEQRDFIRRIVNQIEDIIPNDEE